MAAHRKVKLPTEPLMGDAAELADWCDISARTVETYVQRGIFTRAGPNQFDLKANNRVHIARLRAAASGRERPQQRDRGRARSADRS
jgi:hypothetical protein